MWSQEYNGASSDLMARQEEIARNVARQISGELLSDEQSALGAHGTDDPAAYEDFLRGNFLLAQRNASATARAIVQYDSALARDAAFTRARARSAYAYAQILDWEWTLPGVPNKEALARGLAASARALEEDSTAAEAWLARGYLLTFADPESFAGAEEAFDRAIAPTRRSNARVTLAMARSMCGMRGTWASRFPAWGIATVPWRSCDEFRSAASS